MADYHWTGAAKREFLEALAETGSVAMASLSVGKSRRAAYNLKHRAEGRLFRIGWEAACRIARDAVADQLMERALGSTWLETVRDKETGVTRREVKENRFGLALLSRLDRICAQAGQDDGVGRAARLAEQDFGVFLDLIERGATLATARGFFVRQEDDDWAFALIREGDDGDFDWDAFEGDAEAGQTTANQCELCQNSAENEDAETGTVTSDCPQSFPQSLLELKGTVPFNCANQCELPRNCAILAQPAKTPPLKSFNAPGFRCAPLPDQG